MIQGPLLRDQEGVQKEELESGMSQEEGVKRKSCQDQAWRVASPDGTGQDDDLMHSRAEHTTPDWLSLASQRH